MGGTVNGQCGSYGSQCDDRRIVGMADGTFMLTLIRYHEVSIFPWFYELMAAMVAMLTGLFPVLSGECCFGGV